MRIAQTEVFTFAELTPAAQKVAIAAEQQSQAELFQFETDDIAQICVIIGIQNPEFSWSGFYSQGDGFSFTGSYVYATQALAKIKAYAPQDIELHKIVAVLQDLQKSHGYRLTADITRDHGCRYSHENSVTIQAYKSGEEVVSLPYAHRYKLGDIGLSGIDEFEECFKSLMRHFYKMVESEYEYQTGEECAREYLTDSDNEYTADGKLWS